MTDGQTDGQRQKLRPVPVTVWSERRLKISKLCAITHNSEDELDWFHNALNVRTSRGQWAGESSTTTVTFHLIVRTTNITFWVIVASK